VGISAAVLALIRKTVWSLADAVYDCGDLLLVQRGKLSEQIPFDNIVDVSSSALSRPLMVTIHLAVPGGFGSKVAFVPSDAGWALPFSRSRYPRELRDRARQARSGDRGS
jgi:hypothetical protein